MKLKQKESRQRYLYFNANGTFLLGVLCDAVLRFIGAGVRVGDN